MRSLRQRCSAHSMWHNHSHTIHIHEMIYRLPFIHAHIYHCRILIGINVTGGRNRKSSDRLETTKRQPAMGCRRRRHPPLGNAHTKSVSHQMMACWADLLWPTYKYRCTHNEMDTHTNRWRFAQTLATTVRMTLAGLSEGDASCWTGGVEPDAPNVDADSQRRQRRQHSRHRPQRTFDRTYEGWVFMVLTSDTLPKNCGYTNTAYDHECLVWCGSSNMPKWWRAACGHAVAKFVQCAWLFFRVSSYVVRIHWSVECARHWLTCGRKCNGRTREGEEGGGSKCLHTADERGAIAGAVKCHNPRTSFRALCVGVSGWSCFSGWWTSQQWRNI